MTHFRTCTLCEAMCGIRIETEGTRVTSIRGDDADPFSRGHICPKAVALGDIHADPDRLRRPLIRDGQSFREASWDEAFDRVSHEVRAIQRASGPSAVAVYLGNPTIHNLGALLFGPDLARALHTKHRFSATSVDQLPHMFASFLMFGHQLLLPVPDVDRTDFMLIFGANPVASNGSLMTAPGIEKRLLAIRERGGSVIVIDPRRTETAKMASEHHFIRPGTDALLLLGLLHVLFAEGRVRLGHLTDAAINLERVRELVSEFTPESVATSTGVSADTIRSLARRFADSKRAVCYGRMGVSTQRFGALCAWLVNLMNIVTGHLDVEGGAMFTEPAIDVVGRPTLIGRGSLGRWKSRVRGIPEFGGELPVAVLAEEMERSGPERIEALITLAGNPALSAPNGPRVERALSGLRFMVSVDFYLNETTRHAHVILPPTGPLEHDHYDLALHALAVQNTAKYSPPLFEPPPDARHDWQILAELTLRLAQGSLPRRARIKAEALAKRALGPRRLLDLALRTGERGAGLRPRSDGLSVAQLLAHPHGVVLGPLRPCLLRRLAALGRVPDLAPEPLVEDVERLRRWRDVERPREQLELIGRRHVLSNNSWLHNSLRLVKGKNRCTLLIHPEDALARGLSVGGRARVASRVGELEVDVEITDAVMPGVVSLPHGFGHDRPGTRLSIASQHAGVSINDLTDEANLDALSGNAAFSGTAVSVTRAE